VKSLVPKEVQARSQKQIDEEFLQHIDEAIEKDKRLLKKLAKA
jgi:hypothetical protein